MKRKWVPLGIIVLFIDSAFVPTIAQDTETFQSAVEGNWLYVGGEGSGNYTRIQDAIDAAAPGDIVYVFDDSSPYEEHIVIPISLSLVGENRETTIINGANTSNVVNITADNVTIAGFTIRNGNDSGIIINSCDNTIIGNILENSTYGVSTGIGGPSEEFCNNTIGANLFRDLVVGISLWGSRDTLISGNVILRCEEGIWAIMTVHTGIGNNVITENFIGIWIMIGYHTIVAWNNITSNSRFGLYSSGTNADRILNNNFIGNNQSAVSSQWWIPELKLWKDLGLPLFRRNVWKGNYWDEPRSRPYMIPGILLKTRFHFDWFPAQEPNDIGV